MVPPVASTYVLVVDGGNWMVLQPVAGAFSAGQGFQSSGISYLSVVSAGSLFATSIVSAGTYQNLPSTGGGYSTIQDEGTPRPQQTTMNFTGAGVTATDGPGALTTISIPGAAGSTVITNVEKSFASVPKYAG